MGLLDSLEQRLDKLVNGSFSKAFKSDVQPTELGAVLQQEIDAKSKEIVGILSAPNLFEIELGENDYMRLQAYIGPLATELAKLASDYAIQQRYSTVASTYVSFKLDRNLETGLFKVSSGFGEPPMSEAASVAGEQSLPIEMIPDAASPHLTSISGDSYALTQPVTKLGRGDQAEIQLDDAGVSRLHCAIILGSDVVIKDLGSTNGTIVDGQTITEAILKDGSIINIGSSTLTYTSR